MPEQGDHATTKEDEAATNNTGRGGAPHWADRTVAIFTVLIFLTYITSNYFACRTLNEIKAGGQDTHDLAIAAKVQADSARAIAESAKVQSDAGKRAADAANEALRESIFAFHVDQRPYIVIHLTDDWVGGHSPAPNRQIQRGITFRNIGKTSALKVLNASCMVLARVGLDSRQDELITDRLFERLKSSDRAPERRHDIAPSDGRQSTVYFYDDTCTSERKMSPAEFEAFTKGETVLRLAGAVDYIDSFGISHETQVCYELWGINNFLPGMCETHNTTR